MDIRDNSAIVTGGASGLGLASARRLYEAGAHIVIADLNEEAGTAAAAELGERATFIKTNVTDENDVQAAVDAASAIAPLRAAVHCAGIGTPGRILSRDGSAMELAQFQKVIHVNLIGSFNVLRLASASMAKTDAIDGERGVVIMTASVAAFDGQIGQAAYSASKGGVVGLTLPAARDLARSLVRVVTIAPGIFDTPLLASLPEKARVSLEATVPHPSRLGRPDEYARLVSSIVDNAYINGEVIRIDGSIRMAPK